MAAQLQDLAVPIKIKLAGLWTTVMFCYVYADYFELYIPGKLQGMLQGNMEPLGPVTQSMLIGTAILLALPSLMIVLSVALPARLNRWLNIIVGAFYTGLMMLIAFGGGWAFYILFAAIESVLTAVVVWMAWRWPRAGSTS
jgi:hypothetical protein